MVPFLKWPGGKRWFIFHHASLLPKIFDRYVEPFLGGGSVFFHLEPNRSLLADTNAELIDTYRAIREYPTGVWRALRRYHRLHDADVYYRVRNRFFSKKISLAARMIYLNRTCFNGIYRVNCDGRFNVPVGTKTSVVLDTDDFAALAQLLRGAELRTSDFEPVIDDCKKNDLLFVDPPYTVRHNNNGFLKYNETLFSWADQKRLLRALVRARDRGTLIVATNADHSSLRRMYREAGFTLQLIERYSSISCNKGSRKQFRELLIQANCPPESSSADDPSRLTR
jgi:DNA adenine methylase